MTHDHAKLKELAEAMKGWELNGCWPAEDHPENWKVGRLDEDDNRFPVMTVDTADYEQPQDAKLVASYYAAASPLAVLALINECAGNARMMLTACAELGSIGEALGLGMDDDAEEMRGAIKEMRAELEKLREIPPCASDVYQRGQSVILIGDVAKEVAERICRALSAVTGWRIDWHFIGGRAHFKALPPAPPEDERQAFERAWLATLVAEGHAPSSVELFLERGTDGEYLRTRSRGAYEGWQMRAARSGAGGGEC